MDAIGRHPAWQIGQYHWFKEKTRGLILPGICVQSGEMPAYERESPSCPRFEVSSGFSLEHTGRENLFLSGSIIRMKLREIDPK